MLVYYLVAILAVALASGAIADANKAAFDGVLIPGWSPPKRAGMLSESILLCVLIVLLFSTVAGIRSEEVGTDTSFYGMPSYYAAMSSGFNEFFFVGRFSQWAPLYKIVAWVASNSPLGSFGYFFAVQLLTVAPTLLALYKLLGRTFPIGVALYALFYYPMSLNIMRQSIAMGFVLLSYVYMREHKPFRYLLLVIVAIGFHSSAVLALIIYPLAAFAEFGSLGLPVKLALTIAAIVIFLLAANPILIWLAEHGIYAAYVTGSQATEGGGNRILLEMTGLGVVVAGYCSLAAQERRFEMPSEVPSLAIIVTVGLGLFALCNISFWLYRIGLYFVYFGLLLIPVCLRGLVGRREKRAGAALFLFLVLVIGVDYFAVCKCDGVVPYAAFF